ncbi:MAG: Sec-independent protein translocase subunit TatA [Ottowia sp.]|nr:Sec-independent protein translocase subunit TatA [Ottowia sp.]
MAVGPWQLLIILLIVVMIFGTKKLRNIGGDLGGAIKSFKEGMREDKPAAAGSERITQDASADTIDVQAREAVKQES